MRVLSKAIDVCTGPRRTSYGHPADNLGATATAWSAYLLRAAQARVDGMGLPEETYRAVRAVLPTLVGVDQRDVGWMMAMLKALRDAHERQEDNLIDGAGWIACGGET